MSRGIYKYVDVKEKENNIVIFSGGLDSTLILVDLAKKLSKKESEEAPVIDTLYLETEYIISPKRNSEMKRRKIIIDKIEKEFNVKINDVIVKMVIDYTNGNKMCKKGDDYGGGLLDPQAMIWASTILFMLPDLFKPYTNIYFGHNKTDDFPLNTAKKIRKTLKVWTKELYETSDIEVYFPLLLEPKSSIVKIMLEKYPEYYELAWTCENPSTEEEECGSCVPCITRLQSLLFNSIRNDNKDNDHCYRGKEMKNELENYLKDYKNMKARERENITVLIDEPVEESKDSEQIEFINV